MKFKFNIPNKITIIRLGLVPLFVAVLLAKIPYKNILAAFIFIMLSISDFLDGYFARKKRQVTEFGKLIDPIADKFLISAALIFLIGKGVDLWMAVAIIAREIIITALRIYLIPLRLIVPASSLGKAKTVVQSIAIVFVLLSSSYSWHVMFAAVLLTVVSGLEYVIRIRKITGNKIVNLPNIITLSRLLLIIPFAYYFLKSKIYVAIIIFAAITLSDKLDGISARLMNQKTELGSALDSFTDWIFISTTLVAFVYAGYIPSRFGVLLAIPVALTAVMKLYFIKKYHEIFTLPISKITVGMAYITILAILINFVYKNIFLAVTFLLAVAMAVTFLLRTKKSSS